MRSFTFLSRCTIAMFILMLTIYPARAQTMANATVNQQPRSVKTLKSMLKDLERRYNVSFSYDRNTVEDKRVKLDSAKFNSLQDELNHLLQPLDLYYEKMEGKIYLILPAQSKTRTQSPLFTSGMASMPVQKDYAALNNEKTLHAAVTIQGRVTSSGNEALPGVRDRKSVV